MYAITVRKRQDEMDITVVDMSFLNNVLSIPILVGAMLLHMPRLNVSDHDPNVWYLLGASCVCAAAISVSGFAAQKIISPTSWLTLNNMSKIPAIILSYVFFGGIPGKGMVIGIMISLLSGYLYALSQKDGTTPLHPRGYAVGTALLSLYAIAQNYGDFFG